MALPAAIELRQLPHRLLLLITANCDVAYQSGIAADLAKGIADRGRDQQLRSEILVEGLKPPGEVHGVADHGVPLAARRAAVARHHLAHVNADADPQLPVVAFIV